MLDLAHLALVECVTTSARLGVDDIKVRTYGGKGRGLRPEPVQLRVMTVATGFTAKHGLSKKCLAP